MKQFRTFILFAAVAVLGAAACKPDPVPDSLSLTDTEITAPADGLRQDLTFTTNVAWTATSSASWVTVTPSEGNAGDIKATVVVAANDTYEDRSATVVVTAGSLSATLTVNQTYARVLELKSDASVELDSKAQTLDIRVNANLSYNADIESGCDWITANAGKAAPVESVLGFSIDENTGVHERTASITITPSEGDAVKVTVKQNASDGVMQISKVSYISNRQGTYDSENWVLRSHGQYVIDAETAKGQIRMVITSKQPAKPLEAIPAGLYETDMKDDYKDNTCTVGANGHQFYTTLIENGAEKAINEAQITIAAEGKNYTISAALADESGKIYTFEFAGEIPAITDDSDGLEFAYADYLGDYSTHFATGAECMNVTLHPSTNQADNHSIYTLSLSLYSPKGTGAAIPTGKFSIADLEKTIDSPYINGINDIPAGSMSAYGYSDYVALENGDCTYYSVSVTSGTVTISQNADKTYKFDFDLALEGVKSHYDDDYNEIIDDQYTLNYKKTYDNVAAPEVSDNAMRAAEDGDTEFTKAFPSSTYVGFYVGDAYSTYTGQPGSTFLFGWSASLNGQFTVQLCINSSKEYVPNTNVAGRYSDAPIPAGTYTFQKYAEDALDCIANLGAYKSTWGMVKNDYTGTITYIDGGSITVSDKDVTFDLYASTKDGVHRYHYTGTVETTLYYIRSLASYLPRAAWNSSFLYKTDHEVFDNPAIVEW